MILTKEKEDELRKKWQNASITNDLIFSRVFRDAQICTTFLSKLLKKNLLKLDYVVYEKNVNGKYKTKSIRYDVYAEDKEGAYDIEMQARSRKESPLPLRSRFYQSKLDNCILEINQNYKDLRQSYVIFICTFDPFNKGRSYYSFNTACNEDNSIEFDDKRTIIILNIYGNTTGLSKEIVDFMKYCQDDTYVRECKSKFIKDIDNKVNTVRQDEENWRLFMTIEMELLDAEERGEKRGEKRGVKKGEKRGVKKGVKKGKLEMARALHKMGVDIQMIMQSSGLSQETIESLV